MPHVFRFHEGNASLNGWDLSQQYDEKSIAAISDPAGGAASLPITSIPSPFANFELVRSAFDAVTRNAEVGLTGVTIYHKLVSYALDVLEIFYNYRRFQDHYEIIEWSRNDLKHLKNNNAQNEYYITDLVEILRGMGKTVAAVKAVDWLEVQGVNDNVELAKAGKYMAERINTEWMIRGVTIMDPESTFIGPNVKIGHDVMIYPNTYLFGETEIGNDVRIMPGCWLKDEKVGDGETVR